MLVQLCVGDGVEDLMESLTVESEKSLTSQEPDSHRGVGSTVEHLLGELTTKYSQWTQVIRRLQHTSCLSSDPDSGARQDSSAVPQTLQQEFSLVNLQIRNVNVEVSCCSMSSSWGFWTDISNLFETKI